jgi:TPR repeat protein
MGRYEETCDQEAKALDYYRMAAEAGLSIAQTTLGNRLVGADRPVEDRLAGVAYLLAAADQEYPAAMYFVAGLLSEGELIERNLEAAFKHCLGAAEGGFVPAFEVLGRMYLASRGTERSPEQAARWFQKSMEAGVAKGEVSLAECYLYAIGVEQDLTEAVRLLENAISKGDGLAEYRLAECLRKGIGIAPDAGRAALLLASAAKKQIPRAVADLGIDEQASGSLAADKLEAFANALWSAGRGGHLPARREYWKLTQLGGIKDFKPRVAMVWLLDAATEGDVESQLLTMQLPAEEEKFQKQLESARGKRIKETPFQELVARARTGDAECQFLVASVLLEREGKNPQKSFEAKKWLRQAAEQSHPSARERLAELLAEEQHGTDNPDYDEAISLFRSLTETGSPHYFQALARFMRRLAKRPEGLLQESLELDQQAAEAGNTKAQWLLYQRLSATGKGPEAIGWLRRAAEKGDSLARNRLAEELVTGKLCEPSYAEALEILLPRTYKIARDKRMIGICYKEGPSEIRNDEMAFTYLLDAAQERDEIAYCEVAEMLLGGRGCERDPVQAVNWLRKAAECSRGEACFALGRLLLEGEGGAVDAKEAVKWLRKAVKRGVREAYTELGKCYLNGVGVKANAKKGVELFRAGASLNPPDVSAATELANCLKMGVGCKQDATEAELWLSIVNQGNPNVMTHVDHTTTRS